MVSLLAVDCFQLATSVFLVPVPLFGLICMPIILYMLEQQAGPTPALLCAAWVLFLILLPFPLSILQDQLWVS